MRSMLPTAESFFGERAKSANLTDSIIFVYDTAIVAIMEEYAALKLEEYKKTQELREFYDEDFSRPSGSHFHQED